MTSIWDAASTAFDVAREHGFYSGPLDVAICLDGIHDEVEEAKRATPEELPAELADIIIRAMTLAVAAGIEIEDAVMDKIAFNRTRQYLHGKAGLDIQRRDYVPRATYDAVVAERDALRDAAQTMIDAVEEYIVEVQPELATDSQVDTTSVYRELIRARGALLRELHNRKPQASGHDHKDAEPEKPPSAILGPLDVVDALHSLAPAFQAVDAMLREVAA